MVERSTAELRVAGSIPARNKYLSGQAVCVCGFSTFINASTIQEVLLVWDNVFLRRKETEIINEVVVD